MKLSKKKALITGANGLLGQKLVRAFADDYEVLGLGTKQSAVFKSAGYHYVRCDITNRRELIGLVKSWQPHYIINSAAYTDVDGSEDNREICWKVNVNGVENLAAAAKMTDAFIVHISTDYVFDGKAGHYTEASKPNPLGYYAKSKLAGENALAGSGAQYAIARTMVLYGLNETSKLNFATWLVEKLRSREPVKIVDDQLGHPTLVDDLALAIKKIVELEKDGVYHVTGRECASRYNFALKLAEVFGFDPQLINRIKTADLEQKAPRPLNSCFDLTKLHTEIGFKLSGIKEGLQKLKQQLQLNQ